MTVVDPPIGAVRPAPTTVTMVTGHEREVALGVSDEAARRSAELDRARDLADQTLAEVTPGEATYADAASALGVAAWQRFEHTGGLSDIRRAVDAWQLAVEHSGRLPHPRRTLVGSRDRPAGPI
ncbi:hypothetical protein ACQP2E_28095 [Actinoplanes sp. CA-015351]|uniref:hypothetical protein n=1 Tax=Actinoplanes sp. CA-015351 TaxID=3239897 RepID=UPI003D99AE49